MSADTLPHLVAHVVALATAAGAAGLLVLHYLTRPRRNRRARRTPWGRS